MVGALTGRADRAHAAPGRGTATRTLLLLFVAGLTVSGVTAPQDVQPNDEGLMLQAAARIGAGAAPYGDFWWFYPPGQPYLLAGLQELTGPSLLTWRVVRVLADAGVAVLAYALARREAPSGPALVAWAAAILAMAYPSGPHPFPVALAAGLGALLAFERRPAVAGALTGVCAAWRIEFAAALAAGILLATLAGRTTSGTGAPEPCPGRRRALLRYASAAGGVAVLLYAPVVLAAGAGPAWDLLVDYPLTDFRDYQSLPFPLGYDGPLNTSSPGGFVSHSVEPLLLFYLPLALVTGLAGAAITLAADRDRLRPLRLATGVFALGMLAYLLVRADLFHTAPLAVMVAILAAWAVAAAPARGWKLVPTAVAVAALLYAVAEGLDRRWIALREHTVALDVPVADGVRVPPRLAADLRATVRRIQREVPRGRPIYVTGRRADHVTAGFPLLYVLAQRPNPTRYDIAAPGVVTSAAVQREIAADLERTCTPLVVRWTSALTAAPEPNAAGRSSGVRLLDDYIERRYTPAGAFGALVLLERRACRTRPDTGGR